MFVIFDPLVLIIYVKNPVALVISETKVKIVVAIYIYETAMWIPEDNINTGNR